MSPEILVRSGRRFNFLSAQPEDFHIEDIAHALSNICRYTGHTSSFYSVAQHSVSVSRLLPKELALEGLLHDATEAYLNDISSPLKQLLPDYKKIETDLEQKLAARFELKYPFPPEVKAADLVLLATEQRDLLPMDEVEWKHIRGVKPLKDPTRPLNPPSARWEFMHRYYEITHHG